MIGYRITRLAGYDLENIFEYTGKEWSIEQAEKYLKGLFSCFDSIASGKAKSKAVDHLREGYRKTIYVRHIVFFHIGDDNVAEIIRILHSSMDIENRLLE